MPVIQNVHSTAVVTTLYFNHAKESHTTIWTNTSTQHLEYHSWDTKTNTLYSDK
jgi:hypothetical protein